MSTATPCQAATLSTIPTYLPGHAFSSPLRIAGFWTRGHSRNDDLNHG
ncbi:hypothetical protein [Ruegeria sp. MALMAid1280]